MKNYPKILELSILLMIAVFSNACNTSSSFATVEQTQAAQESSVPDEDPTMQTVPVKQSEGSPEAGALLTPNAAGMTQVEIAGALFGQYLEQYQISILPASCKLISYEVEDVSIDPALEYFREEQGVDMMAWVTYSVQAVAPGFWTAGNGVSCDDRWILDKSMILGLTRVGDVFKLTIHGTGP
jgi:hypothetical protein